MENAFVLNIFVIFRAQNELYLVFGTERLRLLSWSNGDETQEEKCFNQKSKQAV